MFKPITKSVLIPLALTAAASAASAANTKNYSKNIFGSRISNFKRGNGKIVKFLKESGIFIEGVTQKIEKNK